MGRKCTTQAQAEGWSVRWGRNTWVSASHHNGKLVSQQGKLIAENFEAGAVDALIGISEPRACDIVWIPEGADAEVSCLLQHAPWIPKLPVMPSCKKSDGLGAIWGKAFSPSAEETPPEYLSKACYQGRWQCASLSSFASFEYTPASMPRGNYSHVEKEDNFARLFSRESRSITF